MTKTDNILPQGERTELIYGLEKAISCGVQFLQNVKEKMDILSDHKGPSHIVKYDIYRYRYIEAKKQGVPIRFVTEITNDNVQYCKELRKFVSELRHLDGLKGSISLN